MANILMLTSEVGLMFKCRQFAVRTCRYGLKKCVNALLQVLLNASMKQCLVMPLIAQHLCMPPAMQILRGSSHALVAKATCERPIQSMHEMTLASSKMLKVFLGLARAVELVRTVPMNRIPMMKTANGQLPDQCLKVLLEKGEMFTLETEECLLPVSLQLGCVLVTGVMVFLAMSPWQRPRLIRVFQRSSALKKQRTGVETNLNR